MKPEQIYHELKELADKLSVTVSEENLRKAGIPVKSGMCIVKGKRMFVMDKHKSIHKKIQILASQLARLPHDQVYVIPAVRDVLDRYRDDEDEDEDED
jgi:hypothetical protein